MTLVLRRKLDSSQPPGNRLDLYGIVPDRLLGLDLTSIGLLPIQSDGQASTVQTTLT